MKLYTFTDEQGDIIEEVRADNYSIALNLAISDKVNSSTEFYSEYIEEIPESDPYENPEIVCDNDNSEYLEYLEGRYPEY